MPTVLQFRRGTTAQNDAFTGSAGEITFNATTGAIRIHDGTTAGGAEMLVNDGSNANISQSVTLTGDVSGSGTISNLGNLSITTTIADDSHNHVTSNIDGLAEYIADTVGAMVTSNTESDITVTYQDADNTLDFDIGFQSKIEQLQFPTLDNASFIPVASNIDIESETLTWSYQSIGNIAGFSESVADVAGAMWSSNTESNITVTYIDADNTLDISLNNTAVTAGSYGSSTAIPTFTVDAQGRLTAAGTTAISSDMTIAADSGTSNAITVGTDTFTISGGTNINTAVTTDTITINLDASPALTGTPTAPTASSATNNTQIATTAYVTTAIDNLIGGAPGALDTLNELAAAINDDASFAASVTTSLGTKVDTTSAQALGSAANVMTVSNATITLARGDSTTDVVTVNNVANANACSGNAATATTLQTARTIGGVSFDGSANINLPGVNTTGNQNTSGSSASCTGNAATATTLQTARTINGVSFNGSANITVEPYIEDDESTNANRNIIFTDSSTAGYKRLNEDSAFYYNPSTNTVYAGVFSGTATSAQYADLAEKYMPDAEYEPGTVLMFGGEQEVTIADQFATRRVAGVVSTDPAYMMNSELDGGVYIALQGRVPCRVTGIVHKGDLLVASGEPGVAVAWTEELRDPPAGSIIGKSLEEKALAGVDTIEVVVGVR